MTPDNYDISYQLTHDIDWFGIQNGVPFHVASNGDLIPEQIKEHVNQRNQTYVAQTPQVLSAEDILINERWLNEQKERYSRGISSSNNRESQLQFDREAYLRSFAGFARKGFVSIDNSFIGDKYVYKIVAYPKKYRDRFCCSKNMELPEISLENLKGLNVDVWNINKNE